MLKQNYKKSENENHPLTGIIHCSVGSLCSTLLTLNISLCVGCKR